MLFFTKGANAIGRFIGELGTGLKNFFTPVVKNAKVLKGGVDKFGKKIIKPIIKPLKTCKYSSKRRITKGCKFIA